MNLEKNLNVILGTMNFGPQTDVRESKLLVDQFARVGYCELDSAYVYNDGDTERIIGEILSHGLYDSLKVTTKIHPRISGALDGSAVRMQLEESLSRMGRDYVDIIYFHFPDGSTPIEGALKECAVLLEEGKIREFGLSNYPAWMVVEIWYICKENDWPQPTVFQGMYNGLTRSVESELFPALRDLGIRFYAFNPLAGGMLSGKHAEFGKK